MKVVHGPINYAMQAYLMVQELRRQGVDAKHVLYLNGEQHRFYTHHDKIVNFKAPGGRATQLVNNLKECLEENFDIYHFWHFPFIYTLPNRDQFTGIDIPIIKTRGARIVYRFTSFDIRLPSLDLEVNPHSVFRYGAPHPIPEKTQRLYLDYLREYVDHFLVQDPELHQFFPKATIIPRGLVLDEWKYVGITKNECPLVIHAPSHRGYKGTEFVLKAVDELKTEGLKFEFKLLENMPHEELKLCMQQSDIVIDQLLLGTTGVLTLEAMALGKPVVVYLREDLFKPFYGRELPVINATPDNIKAQLKLAIQDYDLRAEIAPKGRQLIEEFHDIKNVAAKAISLYNTLMQSPAKQPTGTKDMPYMSLMAQSTADMAADNAKLKKQVESLNQKISELKDTLQQKKSEYIKLQKTLIKTSTNAIKKKFTKNSMKNLLTRRVFQFIIKKFRNKSQNKLNLENSTNL